MLYYKLINSNEFIGVATSHDLVMYQSKHGILVSCDEELAEYIYHNEIMYRDNWMKPTTTDRFEFENIEIIVINKDEYDALYDAVECGINIEIQPIPVSEISSSYNDDAQEYIAVVQNKNEITIKLEEIQEALNNVRSQTEDLIECIIEMSEVVYG